MSWRSFLTGGIKYWKRLQKFPVILKQPGIYLLSKCSFPHQCIHPNTLGLFKHFGRYTQDTSLVRTVYRTIVNSSTEQRPNLLLRVSRHFTGAADLRHSYHNHNSFHPINKACKPKRKSWLENLFGRNKYKSLSSLATNCADTIVPKEFIAAGCNSAVWGAEIRKQYQSGNETIDELAVKVLYNYYVNSSCYGKANTKLESGDNSDTVKNIPENWILLHRQIQRECELRPQTNHPNIVPIVGHFVDRAPQLEVNRESVGKSSDELEKYTCLTELHESKCSQVSGNVSRSVNSSSTPISCWPGAESFPEAFAGRPYTFYMLMPKFEATLDDLLQGSIKFNFQNSYTEIMRNKTTKYGRSACRDTSSAQLSQYIIPNTANSVISSKSDNVDIDSQIVTDDVYIKHAETYLSVDDIVTILVQIFEAVAELEAHGIAHRDIKPNNILIRQRVPFESDQISGLKSTRLTFESTQDPSLRWLNDKEVEMTNSHLCVALTDFGCAIRTNQSTSEAASSFNQSKLKTALTNLIGVLSDDDNDNAYINHSGNTALLAPEIACIYRNLPIDYSHDRNITGQDYARSDLWAAATLIYPLFGMSNPFVDGTLSSVDYSEDALPQLPPEAPKIMTWILHRCLKRDPSKRPRADEIADILHVWCLVRHLHRRQKASILRNLHQTSSKSVDILPEEILNPMQSNKAKLMLSNNRLCELLNIFWAADWLTGAAQPLQGIRSMFYSRATPGRFELCLDVLHSVDSLNRDNLIDSIYN